MNPHHSSSEEKSLALLAQYAAYHLDRRNVATHLIGIPLIVLAIFVLLALVPVPLPGTSQMNLARVGVIGVMFWYGSHVGLTLLTVLTLGLYLLASVAGQTIAQHPHALAWGVGLFVVGWVFQFIGHALEKRKPAFADDLKGLLIGPLFVVAEVMFALGWNQGLQARVLERARADRALADAARGSPAA